MRSNAAVTLVLLAGFASGVAAQVVTPPPAAKPKEEYTPPATTPAPPPSRPTATRPAEEQFDPSTVEYEPIYTRNDDGTITGPEGLAEVAAITNNPLVDEDVKIIIDELLADRAKRAEQVVISNPNEAIEYAAGVVDRMDIGDRPTIEAVARVAQELQMGDGVIADLANQGLLTQKARDMSLHIWRDYDQAFSTSLAMIYADDENPNAMFNARSRFLMNASMHEVGEAFDRVARRALESLGNSDAQAALAMDGTEFRREAAAVLGGLDEAKLAEVFK